MANNSNVGVTMIIIMITIVIVIAIVTAVIIAVTQVQRGFPLQAYLQD